MTELVRAKSAQYYIQHQQTHAAAEKKRKRKRVEKKNEGTPSARVGIDQEESSA